MKNINYFSSIWFATLALTLALIGCVRVNDKAPDGGASLTLSSLQGLDFGGVVIGRTRTYEILISNTGNITASTLSLKSIVAPFTVTKNTCGDKIVPGDSCKIEISFSPSAEGQVVQTISIDFNNGFINQSVSAQILGKGILDAGLSRETDGEEEEEGEPGPSPSPEVSPSPSPEVSPSPSPEVSPSPSPEVSPSPSPEVSPSPSPEASPSPSPEASPSPSPEVSPSPSPEASPSPSPSPSVVPTRAQLIISDGPVYNFGKAYVGQKATKTFTVTNIGDRTATNLIFYDINNPFDFKWTDCGWTLNAGSSCQFRIEFEPNNTNSVVKIQDLLYHTGGGWAYATVSVQGQGKRHTIFVTSQAYNGNLGGINGANEKCSTLADAAGLSGTWKAVLSTSSVHAKDRIELVTSVYNTDGDHIASNDHDLWNENLSKAVKYDQNGNSVSNNTEVWTGTLSGGSKSSDTCSSWTSSSSSPKGRIGNATEKDDDWLSTNRADCNRSKRLYCISQ